MEKPTDGQIIEAINTIVNIRSTSKQPASFDAIIRELNTDQQNVIATRLVALSKEGKIKAVSGDKPGLYYTVNDDTHSS